MKYRHITFAAGLFFASVAAPVASAGEVRAVVELFTSQGCSSCPAADKLAGELSTDPTLVVMSLPVDYWDYLGWKDTLALHGHSKLQRAYAEVRGDRAIYTPQVVVNGIAHALGSDKAAIEKAIAKTNGPTSVLRLPVNIAVADGVLNVDLPGADAARYANAEVWLCPMSGKVTVAIGRGENRGRKLTYFNIVRRWVKLGNWNGKAAHFSVPLSDFANNDAPAPVIDRVAVIVQTGTREKPGPMLGASLTNLR